MAIPASLDVDLFVLPKGAYEFVLARFKRWEEAHPGGARRELWRVGLHRRPLAPGDQVLSLAGERGAGKTWLLQYLAQHDRHLSPRATYLDLEERFEYDEPEHYLQAVRRRLEENGDPKRVLLLDAVPPQLDEHLRGVEDEVLRVCLAQHSSLVIMALDHPSQVCWRSPSLRGGGYHQMGAFPPPLTQRHFQRLQQSGLLRPGCEVGELLKDATGLPLLNYLLATHPRIKAFELLLEHWFSRIPLDERERVHHYLVAVCPLEVLEHGSIQKMLEVYYHYMPDAAGYPAHASGVRNVLQKYWLAQPMPGSPGRITLVSSVRHAVEELLRTRDQSLHLLLLEMAKVLCGSRS